MYDLITCLTTTPLRLLSVVGSVIAISGFLLALVLVWLRLVLGPLCWTLMPLLFFSIAKVMVSMHPMMKPSATC